MSTWRNIIISVMQGLQNLLQTELSRILSSNTSVELTKQLKNFNSYEKKIEEEIMAKSAQIMQLQNFLKNQIQNIQNIVEENNQLKKEIQSRDKQLTLKRVMQSEFQREVQTLTEMNRASNYIIKCLEQRNQQLEKQIRSTQENSKKWQDHFTQTQTLKFGVNTKKTDCTETAVNTDNSLCVQSTPKRLKQFETIANLQTKIKELQATVLRLKFQNNDLLLKIQCCQSPSNQSVSQSQLDESTLQQRKTTSEILQMVCEQKLVQLRFKGQLVNGSKEKKGVCEYEGNIYYQGYFKNNKRHGLGTLFCCQQMIYRGYWVKGLMEGKGLLKMLQGQIESYEGQFREGKLEGYGLMKLKSGKKILGFWKDGKISGNCLQQNQKSKRLSKPEMIQCY